MYRRALTPEEQQDWNEWYLQVDSEQIGDRLLYRNIIEDDVNRLFNEYEFRYREGKGIEDIREAARKARSREYGQGDASIESRVMGEFIRYEIAEYVGEKYRVKSNETD